MLESSTQKNPEERILMQIKMKGATTIPLVASALSMTNEGARLHLKNLLAKELIIEENVSQGKGRPSKKYSLSNKGLAHFPNTHADLTVNLIQSLMNVLGEDALNAVINDRDKISFSNYFSELSPIASLKDRLFRFAELRTNEGYMAEILQVSESEYYFIENHCPICAAATECQRFCQGELNNLEKLFGAEVKIVRTQHIIQGASRCEYRLNKI